MGDQHARLPRPARPHLAAEQVADLLEGLLPEAEAAGVRTHLDACTDCSLLRSDLEALPSMLAADPAPPIPAHVAERLELALAAASSQRAAGTAPPARRTATVTTLDGRRLVQRSFAALAAAAAVVIGLVLVGDVLGENGGADETAADSSAAGGEGARDTLTTGELVRMTSDDFRSDAEAVYARGLPPDAGRSAQGAEAEAPGMAGTCSAADLRAAGIPGRPGPRALLDAEPVTLVASGPRHHRLVVAYRCADGGPRAQQRAYIDLTR